jgi:hypothetical protein
VSEKRCTAARPGKYGGATLCYLGAGHDGDHVDVLWNPITGGIAFKNEWSDSDTAARAVPQEEQ